MPNGSWKRVIDDMGFPAGLPRTIVVDLTGKLPQGTHHIRIKTNLQIYWDQALVDNGPEMARSTKRTELPLATAHLAFRGYPQQVDGETPGDLTYHYDRISATGPFQWQRGSYTKYGDVTPLLHAIDNHRHLRQRKSTEFSISFPPFQAGCDYFSRTASSNTWISTKRAFTVAEIFPMSRSPYSTNEHYPKTTARRYRLIE